MSRRKLKKNLPKPCLINYSLLITQDLWQAYFEVLLIILWKKFIKLNVNVNVIMKNDKRAELITNIMSDLLNTNIDVAIKNTEKCLVKD